MLNKRLVFIEAMRLKKLTNMKTSSKNCLMVAKSKIEKLEEKAIMSKGDKTKMKNFYDRINKAHKKMGYNEPGIHYTKMYEVWEKRYDLATKQLDTFFFNKGEVWYNVNDIGGEYTCMNFEDYFEGMM